MSKQRKMLRCAYCGAKNKASFEFCVRCSEPLAKASEGSEPSSVSVGDGVVSVGRPLPGVPFAIGAVLLVLGVLGVFAWQQIRATPSTGATGATTASGSADLTSPPPAVDVNMGEASSLVREALAALREGRLSDAIPLLERATRELPNNPSIHVYLANALFDTGDVDRAIDSMQTAYDLDRSSRQIRDNLVTLYKSSGQPEAAIDVLEDALLDDPDDEDGRLELLRLVREQGDHARAVELSADLSNEFEDLEVTFEHGESLRRSGDLPGALEAFQRALEDNPDSAQAHFAVGVTQLQMGNPRVAIESLQTAVGHEPENADFRFRLAEAYENSRQFEQSFAEYENYLQYAPESDPRVPQIREQLETAKKVWAERKKQSQNQ